MDLKPDDLLSSGILFEESLKANQNKIYKILIRKRLTRELTLNTPTKIRLTSDKNCL